MVAPIYGSLTIAHDTGGLHDTVEMLDVGSNTGNGFPFMFYGSEGLEWAIDRAMDFYRLPTDVREAQISRIMVDAKQRFNHEACAAEYIKIYEEMLQRPLTELFDGGNENQNPYTNGGM
jgi:glycogen synthase